MGGAGGAPQFKDEARLKDSLANHHQKHLLYRNSIIGPSKESEGQQQGTGGVAASHHNANNVNTNNNGASRVGGQQAAPRALPNEGEEMLTRQVDPDQFGSNARDQRQQERGMFAARQRGPVVDSKDRVWHSDRRPIHNEMEENYDDFEDLADELERISAQKHQLFSPAVGGKQYEVHQKQQQQQRLKGNPTLAQMLSLQSKLKGNLTNWEQFQLSIRQYELYSDTDGTVDQLLRDMATMPIVHVGQKDGGTQLKLIIDYENGGQALFKVSPSFHFPLPWN